MPYNLCVYLPPCRLCFVNYDRFWGSLMPDPMLACILSATSSGTLLLFSGFFIHRTRMPVAWQWLFWLSPFSYGLLLRVHHFTRPAGYQSVSISQFAGQPITCESRELLPPESHVGLNVSYPPGFGGNRAYVHFLCFLSPVFVRYLSFDFARSPPTYYPPHTAVRLPTVKRSSQQTVSTRTRT